MSTEYIKIHEVLNNERVILKKSTQFVGKSIEQRKKELLRYLVQKINNYLFS